MVRIITDSAADFEPKEYEQLNVTRIPLRVMLGETEYMETVDLNKDRFFELLASTGESPKTAQPSPQCLMDLFEDAKKAGDEAIYISLSSALSGTYQSAVMTCEEARIVDWTAIKSKVKSSVSGYLNRSLSRSPMILPVISEV